MKKRDSFFFVALILFFPFFTLSGQKPVKESLPKFNISLQKRIPSDFRKDAFIITNDIQEWNAKETAIIICDMWNQHWCKGATERVAEMAPFMNNVVSIAREKGVLIVHAPSDCMCLLQKSSGTDNRGKNIRAKRQ